MFLNFCVNGLKIWMEINIMQCSREKQKTLTLSHHFGFSSEPTSHQGYRRHSFSPKSNSSMKGGAHKKRLSWMRGVIIYSRYAKRAHTKIFEYTTKWGSCTAYLLYEGQILSVSKQDYVCERELYCLTFARFLLTSDVSPHSGTLSRFKIDITWGQNYLVEQLPLLPIR
jgi:hypothetical protein